MSAFNVRAFVAELIGTFILVFLGGAAMIVGSGSGSLVASALTSGLILVFLILIYGPVSGGHFNPAVTFGLALNGTLKWGQAAFHWLAQFAGAILGGFLLHWVLTVLNATVRGAATMGVLTDPASATAQMQSLGLLMEAIMTFLLVTAYLRFLKGSAQPGMGAWAVGAALTLAILGGGVFTGGSLNPARTFGITLPLAVSGDNSALISPFTYVVYFFGPLIGATLAVLLNNFFEDTPERDEDMGTAMEEIGEVPGE